MKLPVTALVLSGALLGAACGGSSSTQATTTTVAPVDMRGKAIGTPPEVPVRVADNTFTPAVLRIDPGVTVVWTNVGSVVHNILKSTPNQDFGAQFGVDTMPSGGTYQFKFASPGVYYYQCTLHTGMVGLVAVGNVAIK